MVMIALPATAFWHGNVKKLVCTTKSQKNSAAMDLFLLDIIGGGGGKSRH